MLHISVLGSGSSGNSAVVTDGQTHLLIDAGLSARQLCQRLQRVGIDPADLDGILLTHEHGDHVRGLDVFCRQIKVPVYCNPLTRETLEESLKAPKQWRMVRTGDAFEVGGIGVTTFPVPHDAVEPVGYSFSDGFSSIGVVSDVGWPTGVLKARLAGMDTIFIESNYDSLMLQNDTKRPWSLKQRIVSRHGHLGNDQVAALLAEIATENLERVILGHLSEDCNAPELASRATREALGKAGFGNVEVHCADRAEPTALLAATTRARAERHLPDLPRQVPMDDSDGLYTTQMELF